MQLRQDSGRLRTLATLASLGIVVVGCVSSSNVYEIEPGLFSVTVTGDGFSTADRVMDQAMQKAEARCATDGKRVKITKQQQSRTRMGIDTTLQVQFQCV